MPIRIEEEELIAGAKSSKDFPTRSILKPRQLRPRQAFLSLHGTGKTWMTGFQRIRNIAMSLSDQRGTFSKDVPNISEEEYRELKEEIVPYWKDKTVNARKLALWKRKVLRHWTPGDWRVGFPGSCLRKVTFQSDQEGP